MMAAFVCLIAAWLAFFTGTLVTNPRDPAYLRVWWLGAMVSGAGALAVLVMASR